MRATIIGLAGGLIAIVLGVALTPEIVNEIDTLNNVIGETGNCEVKTTRYEINAARYNTAGIVRIYAYPSNQYPSDAKVGKHWLLDEYLADGSAAGVPQAEKCDVTTDTLISFEQATPFTLSDTTDAVWQTAVTDVIEDVIPEDQRPTGLLSTAGGLEADATVSVASEYVGIEYVEGEERSYAGVMVALVALMPLLIIVGIIAFIVMKFGMGSDIGLRLPGSRKRRR